MDFDSDDDLPLLPPAVAAMQWRQLGFTPVIRQPFSGPAPGATMILDENATELDFFNLFVPRATILSFVNETNAYAARKQRLNGQDQNWINVTYSEMCAFLGLRVFMSVFVLPTLDMYWSKDFMFGNTFAVQVMKRDRFDKISSYFHVADTSLNAGLPAELSCQLPGRAAQQAGWWGQGVSSQQPAGHSVAGGVRPQWVKTTYSGTCVMRPGKSY